MSPLQPCSPCPTAQSSRAGPVSFLLFLYAHYPHSLKHKTSLLKPASWAQPWGSFPGPQGNISCLVGSITLWSHFLCFCAPEPTPRLPWWLRHFKGTACNAGDLVLIPELGRSPGGGHGDPLQYSCLENPHGQRNLAGTVHGVAQSQTRLRN